MSLLVLAVVVILLVSTLPVRSATRRHASTARRIEIAFYRLGDDIYLSGIPGPKTCNWPGRDGKR
jgi:hypothetical protein